MNVGAKIFGSPSGEPKHHNQTNAQKKCEKLLTLPTVTMLHGPEPCRTQFCGPQLEPLGLSRLHNRDEESVYGRDKRRSLLD
jgi:hypothetical protein